MKRLWPMVCAMILLAGCAVSQEESRSVEEPQQQSIIEYRLDNLHHVDEGIYRSGQPSAEDMAALEKRGLKSVLNLRRHHSDGDEIKGTGLILYELPVNAGSISEAEIRSALQIIKHAPKPILIHCWHGSDRTGAVVAAYRITAQGWNVEDAIRELMDERYGHHKIIYRNIPKLLRSIDWKKFN